MIVVERNVDVASLTTFRIHAMAAAVVSYHSTDDLIMILADVSLPRPMKVIGEGSNLLFTSDFHGTLLKCSDVSYEIGDDGTVTAAAGMKMDVLCGITAKKGLWGLENLSGIPGTVGASAVQNVGAYGVEAGDLIEEAVAFDTIKGETVTFSNKDMGFGYRDSMFKKRENIGRYIIVRVKFRLSEKYEPRLGYGNLSSVVASVKEITPETVRGAIISIRDDKLPDTEKIGSAGSFFKNPVVDREQYDRICYDNPTMRVPCYDVGNDKIKIPAAWLIDAEGWKGRRCGGAEVWRAQPLVIANIEGRATADDVVLLEDAIIASVEKRFGITLLPEVEHIGTVKGL